MQWTVENMAKNQWTVENMAKNEWTIENKWLKSKFNGQLKIWLKNKMNKI
jgi:hypothetical protein